MITIRETQKRKYDIKSDDTILKSISLISSTITNKFGIIAGFVEGMSKLLGKEFDDWFVEYITTYIDSGYDSKILLDRIDELKKHCDDYLEKVDINFNNYINREKVSKNSIFFDAEELENLIKASSYLKLYFAISQDIEMRPPLNTHKEIYNILIEKISGCEIVFKLFKLVSSKTYRYNISDKAMWDYIKLIHCKTTDMHVNLIFNFLMNNILVTCQTESNPIPYFSSVIDQSIKWILRGVYKETIIYSDTISTEDIHTISGKDNLLSYCYNDTIGKLLIDAGNYLEEVGIEDITKFNETIGKLKEPSLIAHYITYPILSKVFNIPYRYFRPIAVEHSYLLNILTLHYMPDELKEQMETVMKLMLHYNIEKPIVKTTYKVKDTDTYFKTFKKFLTFKSKVFPYDVFSDFIGKIARNTYVEFTTGNEIANFPLTKLESDMIRFYNNYFSNELDDVFSEMKKTMEKNL